jgi:hypothetical protein
MYPQDYYNWSDADILTLCKEIALIVQGNGEALGGASEEPHPLTKHALDLKRHVAELRDRARKREAAEENQG